MLQKDSADHPQQLYQSAAEKVVRFDSALLSAEGS